MKTLQRSDIATLLLAAGRGRRFGSDKRIARLASGEMLLSQSISCFEPYFKEVFVALSARVEDDVIEATLQGRVTQVLRCASSEAGMGSTLGEAMKSCHGSLATLIALGDMPVIDPSVIERLVAHAAADRIVFPRYRGRRGHPVIFGRDFYADLAALSGDRGAGRLIEANPGCCCALEVDDPGVVLDVDTPADQQRAQARLQAGLAGGASA